MKATLVLPVPRTVTSTFVVAALDGRYDTTHTSRSWTSDSGAVRHDVRAIHTAYVRPDSFYLDAGTPLALMHQVQDSDLHLLVTVGGTAGWPAHPARTSRNLANELAYASAGLLLDPLTGVIEPPTGEPGIDPADEPLPALDQWASCQFDADSGQVVLTGLSRFGLPDICAQGVTADIASDVDRLLTLIGSVLLQQFWAALADRPCLAVEISVPMLIDSNFGRRWIDDRGPSHEPASRAFVRLAYLAHRPGAPRLQATWPEGYGGAQSEWWQRTAAMLLPTVPRHPIGRAS